ncbi:hypothetical protein ACLB1E_34065 [Escherichia coli]
MTQLERRIARLDHEKHSDEADGTAVIHAEPRDAEATDEFARSFFIRLNEIRATFRSVPLVRTACTWA